jgi:hypothetical protein
MEDSPISVISGRRFGVVQPPELAAIEQQRTSRPDLDITDLADGKQMITSWEDILNFALYPRK